MLNLVTLPEIGFTQVTLDGVNFPDRRYFHTYNGTDTRGSLDTPVTFTGDSTLNFQFACSDVTTNRNIVGASTTDYGIFLVAGTGLLRAKLQTSLGASTFITIPTISWADGDMHTGKLTRVGDLFTLSINGSSGSSTVVGALSPMYDEIGVTNNATNSFYSGQISYVTFNDQSGASDVITNYIMDNDSITLQYARGEQSPSTKKITYTNFVAGDIEMFELNRTLNQWEAVDGSPIIPIA